jgi:molecular chaperone HtpG
MLPLKKISNYITRKVADKLKSLFTESRDFLSKKWNDIKIVTECYLKINSTKNRALFYTTVDDKIFTLEELKKILLPIKPIKMAS